MKHSYALKANLARCWTTITKYESDHNLLSIKQMVYRLNLRNLKPNEAFREVPRRIKLLCPDADLDHQGNIIHFLSGAHPINGIIFWKVMLVFNPYFVHIVISIQTILLSSIKNVLPQYQRIKD